MVYSGPPLAGSKTSVTLVDPERTLADMGTVLSPRTEVMSWVNRPALALSPQLTTEVTPLTRSKGMTLLGRTVDPTAAALFPEAVGAARTTFASISLFGLRAGRGSRETSLNRKSDAAFRTGTAMIGVMLGTTIAAFETGGRKRSE